MLIDDVERYVALRRSLGFKIDKVAANWRAFVRFATSRGDTHLKAATAVAGATMAPRQVSAAAGWATWCGLRAFFGPKILLMKSRRPGCLSTGRSDRYLISIRPKKWLASSTRPASFVPT
jgi:hypothetical protein